MQRKLFNLFRYALPPLAVLLLVLVILTHIRSIGDWFRLYNYSPPPAVSDLASQDTMTPLARRLFYINHPEVDDRSAFNAYCASEGEQTIVLGCYHPVDRGIFVFAVQDIRLDGVEQVTSAHEMLHAAYDRLSASDKDSINKSLESFYHSHLLDQRIKDTMAAYQKSEPRDVVNEMHSIFGTEVPQLTPELENYYKRYFDNRSKVTQYASTYQAEFTSRSNKVKEFDQQLTTLKSTIDTNSTSLKQQQAQIESQRSAMDADRSAGNIEAYNAQVGPYNRQVDAYNALVKTTQAQISQYNTLVNQRNSLALEVQQLTQSIDSQFQPINQ